MPSNADAVAEVPATSAVAAGAIHDFAEAAPALPAAIEKTAFRVLCAVSLAHMLNDICQFLLPAIYPVIKESLNLNFSQIGLITFVFQTTASLLQPVIGIYTDRRPKPYALAVGMGAMACGLLLLSRAGEFTTVLVAASLVGLGASVFHPEASRIGHMASGGQHGLAQSMFQVGGNFGASLAPLLAASIVVPHGQGSIAWFSLVALAGMIVVSRLGAWYNARLRTRLAAGRPFHIVAGPAFPTRHIVVSIAILLLLIISKFFYLVSFTSYYTFYLKHRFGVSTQASQVYLSLFLLGTAVGTAMGGPIGDRLGRKVVIWFSILGVAPFSLVLPYVNLPATVVLACIAGVILSSAFSAILVYAQELIPGKVGTIAGLFFGLAFGISAIASAALGQLADRTSIEYVFQLCAYLPLMGLLAGFLPNVERRRRS